MKRSPQGSVAVTEGLGRLRQPPVVSGTRDVIFFSGCREALLQSLRRRQQYPVLDLDSEFGRPEHADSPVLFLPADLDQSFARQQFTRAADLVVLQARLLPQRRLRGSRFVDGPLKDIEGNEGKPLVAKFLQCQQQEEVARRGNFLYKLFCN